MAKNSLNISTMSQDTGPLARVSRPIIQSLGASHYCKSMAPIFIMALSCTLASCTDTDACLEMPLLADQQSDIHSTRALANGYWESWERATIDGESVNMPWHEKSTKSTVPPDILKDIAYNDGWDMIYPRTEDDIAANWTHHTPYLIFHNRYTGVLKVFAYVVAVGYGSHNNGFWQITTDVPTSLFAFETNPISKVDERCIGTYNVGTITMDTVTRGFHLGWNCFQMELAYDPNQKDTLIISAAAQNQATLTFNGKTESNTKGVIATSSGSSNPTGGIAKIAGNGAADWIKAKINDKTILGISPSLVSEGVKALVSGGVGSIIGAVTGFFKKDDTSRSIHLTTNGSFTCGGTLTVNTTLGIDPIQLNLKPQYIGYLGAWGLKEVPALLFTPYAALKSPQEYTNGYTSEYILRMVNTTTRATLLVNPRIKNFTTSTPVITEYYQTDHVTRPDIWGRSGVLGKDPMKYNKVYEHLFKPNFYILADVAFKSKENVEIPVGRYEAPMEVFIPNVPNGPQGALPYFRYNSTYVATVGLKCVLPNGDEAYSYHQCIPKIDWKYSDYNNRLYWNFYPCEPVVEW